MLIINWKLALVAFAVLPFVKSHHDEDREPQLQRRYPRLVQDHLATLYRTLREFRVSGW